MASDGAAIVGELKNQLCGHCKLYHKNSHIAKTEASFPFALLLISPFFRFKTCKQDLILEFRIRCILQDADYFTGRIEKARKKRGHKWHFWIQVF